MNKVFEGVQEVRRDQVYLLVDHTLRDFAPWQPRPPQPQPLDARLAVAVEIGRATQTEGFQLAALATDDTWHPLATPGDFYLGIASRQPQRDEAGTWPVPPQPGDERGLHILVLGRWTDSHRARLEQWQQRGVLVLVYLVPEAPADAGILPLGQAFVEVS